MQSILATIEQRLDDDGWDESGIILKTIEDVLNEHVAPLLERAELALRNARTGTGFNVVEAHHVEDDLYDLRTGRD